MKTIDMEVALMHYLGIRQNLIVPNVSWGMCGLHECDILSLTKSGYATEIEIKVSKSDLKNDCKKKHGHKHKLISKLFFAVPAKLEDYAKKIIPEGAGLLIVHDSYMYSSKEFRYVRMARPAKRRKDAYKWDEAERYNLARLGAMRILGLKVKIMKGH